MKPTKIIGVIILIILINLGSIVHAQVYLNKRFDNNSSFYDAAYSIITDSGFIYSAITTLWNDGIGYLAAPAVLKFDSLFNINILNIYQFPMKNAYTFGEGSLFKISDGFILSGLITDSNDTKILLIKTTFSGDTIWTRRFGGTPYQASCQVQELTDGNYVVSGQKTNGARSDAYFMKLDTNGNLLWDRFYGDTISGEIALSFANTIDNGFAFAGYSSHPGPNFDIYIVKTDSMGIVQWDTVLGSQWDEEARCVISTSDGNIVIGGNLSIGGPGQDGSMYMFKMDLQGNILWQKNYGYSYLKSKIYSLKELTDGSLIAAGRVDNPLGGRNGFILKTNIMGDSLWYFEYFNSSGGINELFDIALTDDGGFVACGSMSPSPPDTGNQDCWFLKVDSVGCEVSNCILSVNPNIGSDPSITIFPNPFSERIFVRNEQQIDLEISLYDVLGRKKIKVNSSGELININTNELATGIYLISVNGNKIDYNYKVFHY